MSYYFEVLKKYAVFNGRASRKEYWMWFLFTNIVYLVLSLGEAYLKIAKSVDLTFINTVYIVGTFLPGIAVAVRRIHDTGRNGWYILIPIYNIVLMVKKGTDGPNEYGENPNPITGDPAVLTSSAL